MSRSSGATRAPSRPPSSDKRATMTVGGRQEPTGCRAFGYNVVLIPVAMGRPLPGLRDHAQSGACRRCDGALLGVGRPELAAPARIRRSPACRLGTCRAPTPRSRRDPRRPDRPVPPPGGGRGPVRRHRRDASRQQREIPDLLRDRAHPVRPEDRHRVLAAEPEAVDRDRLDLRLAGRRAGRSRGRTRGRACAGWPSAG